MAHPNNVMRLWRGAIEPAEVGASGNEYQAWRGAVEPAAAVLVARKGGVRWLREPDPAIREEKTKELVELIKPKLPAPIKPKLPASASEQPPGPLLTAVQDATANMTQEQQTRTERLLEQTGISLRELLILLR